MTKSIRESLTETVAEHARDHDLTDGVRDALAAETIDTFELVFEVDVDGTFGDEFLHLAAVLSR